MLATLAAYVPAVRCGYVWDDDVYVTDNPLLHDLDGLRRIWFDIGATVQYYPLVFSTFWVEYHLWGLEPVGYHITNVLLQVVNALLLWRILRGLGLPGAWFAAALFALHPVHVESVAWITERKNVLSGAFYLASLLLFCRFAALDASGPESAAKAGRVYVAGFVLFLCALLSKTVTCSLPAVVLLLIWWRRGRISRNELLCMSPLLVVGAAAGALTAWLEKHNVGAAGSEWMYTFAQRCLIAGRALWFYLENLLWPVDLTFVYPKWAIDGHNWQQFLYPISAAALVVGLLAFRSRLGRGPLVAALYFGGTLFPALGFVDTYPLRYYFVADHFQYLASLAPIVLFAYVIGRLSRGGRDHSALNGARLVAAGAASTLRRWTVRLAMIAILSVCGVLTWRQGGIYRDEETLFLDTIAKNPSAAMAHTNLGVLYAKRGRMDEAVARCRTAIAAEPGFIEAHYNLGTTLSAQKKHAEAVDAYRQTLRLDPRHFGALNNLGNAYLELGAHADAAARYEEALRLQPRAADTRTNLGVALGRMGRLQEAVAEYESALRLDPHSVPALNNLAAALMKLGRADEAISRYRQVARLEPNLADGQFNLGSALLAAGKPGEAIDPLRRAVELNPQDAEARRALDAARLAVERDAAP